MKQKWPFEELKVWREAFELTDRMYALLDQLPDDEQYALNDQLRRATTSVVLNISEGKGKHTDKEFLQFLYNARGSLYEMVTCLKIATRREYFTDEETRAVEERAYELHRMISGLISHLKDDND